MAIMSGLLLLMPGSSQFLPTLFTLVLLLFAPLLTSSSRGARLLPPASSDSKYAVVFDAGSTGSRVHVYCFDENMDLVSFGDEGYQVFRQTSPGLSSYADDPEAGAESLRPLLNAAIDVVPAAQQAETPVRLGATAGLRLLPGESAENLLRAVSKVFEESPFKFESDWVTILDGSQEGGYSWISMNYLLGNIGKPYGNTVASVDLGGGSVQMSYAISDVAASNAPKPVDGESDYVTDLSPLGVQYHVYTHSYLLYGLLAGRAEILKLVNESESCPCLPKGYQGEYVYDSVTYKAVGSAHGASVWKCRRLVLEALDIYHSCDYSPCTFGGVWSGGGGDGQNNLYVASFFFDRAMQAGIITDPTATEAKVKPADFRRLARKVCKLSVEEVGNLYPSVAEEDRPFFCLDLEYEYSLLVDGFGLGTNQVITLIQQIIYKNSTIDAQWTLGCAIDVISSSGALVESKNLGWKAKILQLAIFLHHRKT